MVLTSEQRLVLMLVLWASTTGAVAGGERGAWTNDLLASFPLAGDASDRTGRARDMDLIRTQFAGDSLFLNGEYEHGGSGGFRAIAGIPGLGYESLTFGLHFFPLDFEPAKAPSRWQTWVEMAGGFVGWNPVFGHSGHETIMVGGTSYRWLGYRQVDDALELTLNNQDFVHRFTNITVRVGQWHSLVCTLDLEARRVVTLLDGRRLQDVSLPADFQLRVNGAESNSDDREFTFTNYSNGEAFHGYAARLIVASRALAEAELGAFVSALLAEAPAYRPTSRSPREWVMLTPCLLLGAGWLWFRRGRSRSRATGG